MGILDNALRERLLREQDLNLDKAVQMCRAAETTRAQAKELRREGTAVHAVKAEDWPAKRFPKQRPTVSHADKNESGVCQRCGNTHPPNRDCLVSLAIIVAKRTIIQRAAEPQHARKLLELFVDCVLKEDDVLELSEDTGDDDWVVPITVNDTIIPFKLDTGAQRPEFEATGERVPVKGRCVATLEHRGKRLRTQLLIVAQKVKPILGESL